MAKDFTLAGTLGDWDVPSILQRMHARGIDGQLLVSGPGWEKCIWIEDQRVRFATSSVESDMLGRFLVQRGIIDEDVYQRSTRYMQQHGVKHGRALLEMGVISHDHLWEFVLAQLRYIVFSLFPERTGTFAIQPLVAPISQNIALNNDIPSLLLEGIRQITDDEFIHSRFDADSELHAHRVEKHLQMKLKPFELHVLDLVHRHGKLSAVLAHCELLPPDTLKSLYLLRVLDAISDHADDAAPKAAVPVTTRRSFANFQEALTYFNGKYGYIYRLLSKEIGPVALSILSSSIEEILDTLPPFFANLQLSPDGNLEDGPILKALWYRNIGDTLPEFLRGLEEILYAEIYAVRKHLGRENEQALLQWIRETGN